MRTDGIVSLARKGASQSVYVSTPNYCSGLKQPGNPRDNDEVPLSQYGRGMTMHDGLWGDDSQHPPPELLWRRKGQCPQA